MDTAMKQQSWIGCPCRPQNGDNDLHVLTEDLPRPVEGEGKASELLEYGKVTVLSVLDSWLALLYCTSMEHNLRGYLDRVDRKIIAAFECPGA
jgi:hypothetical protein